MQERMMEVGSDTVVMMMELKLVYRGKQYTAVMPVEATVGELGEQMSQLTGVALHTMRFLVPQKGGRVVTTAAGAALMPASEQHSSLALKNSGFFAGTVIRMMGASPDEIKEVSQPANKRAEDRILGFAEEERRAKQRFMPGKGVRQLPQGPYTFSEFQTLKLPGIELNPGAPQALAIMHKLASDPGIVAIMNKHRWQVGAMTELAPVGYVGISPKCLLGFNKNRGEEISLRLRTDDLRGFRKYDSIRKTLLHELAHMVHDEHDEKFHALDKQLNQESISLDWTRSTAHTVSGVTSVEEDDDASMDIGGVKGGRKLGGSTSLARDSRRAAAEAALLRMERNRRESESQVYDKADKASSPVRNSEPEPEDSVKPMDYEDSDSMLVIAEGQLNPNDHSGDKNRMTYKEPDPDEALARAQEPDPDLNEALARAQEPDPDLDEALARAQEPDPDEALAIVQGAKEPDPDEALARSKEPDPDEAMASSHNSEELDLDEALARAKEPDPDEALARGKGADPDEAIGSVYRTEEHDPDKISAKKHEPDANDVDLVMVDDELSRIQDATAAAMAHLRSAIATLKKQASPSETEESIKTLFTILRNVINHPNETKYRRLRKGNPTFQHRVAKYGGAVEILRVVGFSDGECVQGTGASDCLVLKSSDPALLWLASSSLEASLA